MTTWIRVEDAFGQYDHPKDLALPKGAKPVKDYPEHDGPWAREGKPRTDKAGQTVDLPPSPYDEQNKDQLEGEIAERNAGRDEGHQIVVEGKGNKPDLIAALVADDAANE